MDEKTRLKRLDALLDEALELSSGRQEDLVRKISAKDPELGKRLATLLGMRDQAHDFLEGTLKFSDTKTQPTESAEGEFGTVVEHGLAGTVIGPWRLLEEIGSGGMGTVYLAARDDGQFNRRVAFKVIRTSRDNQRLRTRFAQERTLLASLSHKGIAQLLDSGVSDSGLPYYIMEYIQGKNILAYCDAKNLGVDQRLRLFLDVCDAVAYAHRALVIHRDIKSNNILVTEEGEVKLLDFGIAKALQPEVLGIASDTSTMGGTFFTPDCAAPEQIKGETVTTATDIYALGVLLYRLLAGKSHLAARGSAVGQQALLLALFESKPLAPSKRLETTSDATGEELERIAKLRATSYLALRRRLSGDLDAIVLKCLEHQPVLRYQQVDELVRDIRNHLAHRPVKARQGGALYFAGRFLRRHLLSTTTATAFIALLLILFLQQWRNADQLRHERNLARQEAARAQEMVVFLKDLFESANPKLEGGQLTVHELLLEGIRNIGFSQAYHPDVRADLLQILGSSLKSLGDLQTARMILEDAARKQATSQGESSLDYAMTARLLALIAVDESRTAEALERMGALWPTFERQLEPGDPRWLELERDYSVVLQANHQYEQARTMIDRALELAANLPTVSEYQVGRLHLVAAQLAEERQDPSDAVSHGKYAVGLLGRALGDSHPQVAEALVVTANGQLLLNQPQKARQELERARGIFRMSLGENSIEEAKILGLLAKVASREGHFDQAYQLQKTAFSVQSTRLTADSLALASARMAMAEAELDQGQTASADALLSAAKPTLLAKLPPEHLLFATLQSLTGRLLLSQRQLESALEQFTAALTFRERAYGQEHPTVALLWLERAQVLTQMENWGQAEQEFKRGLDGLGENSANYRRERTQGQARLGNLLAKRGRCQEALPYLEAAYQLRQSLPPIDRQPLQEAYETTLHSLGREKLSDGQAAPAN